MIGNVKFVPIKHRDGKLPVKLHTATHSRFSLRHGNDSLQITGRRPDDWRVKLAETHTAIKTSLQRPATLGSKILAVRLSALASVRKKQVLWKAMSITGHADRIPFAALCPDVLRAAPSCAPKEN